MRLTILPALLLSLFAAPVVAQERIPSHCFALAQGIAQVMPARFGADVAPDQVRIHFIDHASFAIASGGKVAVTDFTGYTGLRDWVPDVVTMNNAHSTHWTANPDPRIPNVLQGWANEAGPAQHALDLGAMLVRNVPTDVRSRWGEGVSRKDGNSIFVFEAGGLCIGHLGHLHHAPDEAQYASIGRLDVVMVPVDGGYTMAVSEIACGRPSWSRCTGFRGRRCACFWTVCARNSMWWKPGCRRWMCRCATCRGGRRSWC